jgi:hypothetical protein
MLDGGGSVRRATIARIVSAAGVALALAACSSVGAAHSPSTVQTGPAVTTPVGSSTGVSPSTSTTDKGSRSTTTTAANKGTTGTTLNTNDTNQIDNELSQLQTLLGDTDTDFAAGQKES